MGFSFGKDLFRCPSQEILRLFTPVGESLEDEQRDFTEHQPFVHRDHWPFSYLLLP